MAIRILVALAIISIGCLSRAGRLEEMTSGQHSFLSLGDEFHVKVPVRDIPNAHLAFLNEEAASAIGLLEALPGDTRQREEVLLRYFAKQVDPTGRSPLKWFATRYQDSGSKNPGSALGDGRALWSGEIRIVLPNGRILYIDVVTKGLGATPLAWTNNPTHSNGRQEDRELIHSGMVSMVNRANRLDTTVDIMGFHWMENGILHTASVRVGFQLRPAHLAYFDDQPELFKKTFEFSLLRALGLPLDTPVTASLYNQYFREFSSSLAEEAARFYDLTQIHASPTRGNKTLKGGTIDLAEIRFLDGYHTNFAHLHGKLKVSQQNEKMRNYLSMVLGAIQRAQYKPASVGGVELVTLPQLERQFDQKFQSRLDHLSLRRLGLSDSDIEFLPPELKREFGAIHRELNEAVGTKKVNFTHNSEILPAAFEVRKILRNTMRALQTKPDLSVGHPVAQALFRVSKSWASPHTVLHLDLKKRYLNVVKQLVQALSLSGVEERWIAQAETINAKDRLELTDWNLWNDKEKPIVDMMISGQADYVQVTEAMRKVAVGFIDRMLPERASNSLPAVEELRTTVKAQSSNGRLRLKPVNSCEELLGR